MKTIEEKNSEKNKKETNPEDNFVLKFSPEEINEMLLDYSDEEQKKLRPFSLVITSIVCLMLLVRVCIMLLVMAVHGMQVYYVK